MEKAPKTLEIFVCETFEVVQEKPLSPVEAPRVLGFPALLRDWAKEIMFASPTLFARPPTGSAFLPAGFLKAAAF